MRYISKLFLNSLIISKKAMTLSRVLLTLLLICTYIGALTAQKQAKTYARKPVVERYNNMVVTAHPEATKIGVKVLADGGNAVDAAVAVHFALAVCYPTAGNIGGGGFALYRNKNGAFDVLDYREVAPGKASKNMFLDSAGNVIKDLSLKGALAAGVPGSVDGMWELHKKYGSTNWNKLIQPAIDLARNGFPITAMQAREFRNHEADFSKYSHRKNYLIKSVVKDGYVDII
jgi:gamma-glutamyltranspeptidase/glutathione hydrolase